MWFLEPAVRLVGQLSFRNKLRATALVFGLPLLIALGVIFSEIEARVSALRYERQALAVQVPALRLMGSLHQYMAAAEARQEGDASLDGLVRSGREATVAALADLRQAVAENPLLAGRLTANPDWLAQWEQDFRQTGSAEAADLGNLHSQLSSLLAGELDKLNEAAGLLVDGNTSSSRLIDIATAHLPELVENTGNGARLGALVLATQSLKSSRRTELTLLRGNFNPLVQWSMDSAQRVGREHPEMAADLDEAGSRLNTAYLAIQEAMTTKMLDTTDFGMTPADYLHLTRNALDESLGVAAGIVGKADILLGERLLVLENQRNAVVLAMVVLLAIVLAGFIAAYISIMRGLNGLADAVDTMAAGDLAARVEITSQDEIGAVGKQFNLMAESLAQRTAQLHEKTADIQAMLQSLPQGILTIVPGGTVHGEYSAYLEQILETRDLAGQPAIALLFAGSDLGSDAIAQVDAAVQACIGEDLMNYEFNAHLLAGEMNRTLPDGRVKSLELTWAPICDDDGQVEKLLVCLRDVTQLRQLEAEARQQKRELEMIGQILQVNQEKFHEFIDSARQFAAENEALLGSADGRDPELVTRLFRNMHTIKGNARTYGLLHLTNAAHEAEQAYDELRRDPPAPFDRERLLAQLQGVLARVEEYASLNEVKLGRRGPGRRGSAEKYVMVQRTQVERMLTELDAYDLRACRQETLAAALQQVKLDLRLIGTETMSNILDGVFDSLPSLARELGKEPPRLQVIDQGVVIRNQVADLMRNVFMHLYRNALDHGIETPRERQAAGKPAAGTIRLDLELDGERLVMSLQDDGRGLALARIRAKGLEKGLIDADHADDDTVAQLIFAAGLSTASAVTEVSGRGVGMDAVREFIRREGGEIRICFTDDGSCNPSGAEFRSFATEIHLPARFAVDSRRAPAAASHREEQRIQPDRAGPVEQQAPGLLPGRLVTV